MCGKKKRENRPQDAKIINSANEETLKQFIRIGSSVQTMIKSKVEDIKMELGEMTNTIPEVKRLVSLKTQ